MPSFIRPSLENLAALAVEAGRAIMEVHDAGAEAIEKSDGSPVTLADQRAETIILAGLARLAPAVPVLAEEESAAGRVPDLGARFFCVDPLDGTKDFLAGGTGEFTVNIALIEEGAPISGVIFSPATGALYAGEPGRAFKAEWNARTGARIAPDAPIKVAPRTGPWRTTTSKRHGGDSARPFLDALGPAEHLRASSSIKFCLIAEGKADLYPRFGPVSEWDAAAGHAILNAAGGGMIRLNGAPVTYGRLAERFLVDGFVAYGDEAAQAEARRLLAQTAPA